ncbi:MAG: S8 family serine peptidase [Bacteroidia bacterium]
MRWLWSWLLPLGGWTQSALYLVHFQPKPDSLLPFPEQYLSPAAIERRRLHGVPIDGRDLPIPLAWIEGLARAGRLYGISRWLNAALVETTSPQLLGSLPGVACVEYFCPAPKPISPSPLPALQSKASPTQSASVINAFQLDQLKLPFLHQRGYTGQGIRMAIFDAGFPYFDQMRAFEHIFRENRYLGGRDFVDRNQSIFEDNAHGTHVASVIVAYDPQGTGYLGGAPHVSVLLARTENALSETRLEEWNWAEAAEWADSHGVHIIQSSLGYSTFDDPAENYTYRDMNGRTAISTQAARIATQKGILVVASAGNEGNSPWHYITAPSDADSILGVGAINVNGEITPFSSRGPSADRRIKPDVVALGWGTQILGLNGTVQYSAGTSFSAPLVSALAACLWQAMPHARNWEIREAIIRSADRYHNPDTLYGYGLPDAERALAHLTRLHNPNLAPQLQLYPNPASDYLTLFLLDTTLAFYDFAIYDIKGNQVHSGLYRGLTEMRLPIGSLSPGPYLLELLSRASKTAYKAIFVKL